MHAEHVRGVIRAQQALQATDAPDAQHAGDGTDGDGAKRTHQTRRRGDANQARDRTRGHAQGGRLALGDFLGERPGQDGSRRGQHGVDEGQCRATRGFQVGAGVEAEPAHPQQHRADVGEGDVVRLQCLAAITDALADEVRAHQACDTGIDVHYRTACEIQRAQFEQIATACPDHVRQRQVAEGEPQHREQQYRGQLGAFGESTDDQRTGDAGEGGLEHDEHVFRQLEAIGERVSQRVHGDPFQEHLVQSADPRVAAGECQAVTVGDPQDDQQRKHRGDLDQYRQHVLGTHQAAVEQGQAGHHHQQHQHGGSQHPGHVALVDHGLGFGFNHSRRFNRRSHDFGDDFSDRWGGVNRCGDAFSGWSGSFLGRGGQCHAQRRGCEYGSHAQQLHAGFPPGEKTSLHMGAPSGIR